MAPEKIATRDAYGEALIELGKENENIVALDADLASSTRSGKFGKEFPDRFFNIGIAEADMMATAAGLAAGGKIPFASTFAIFAAGRAFDQVRNTICYPRLNVKIGASHAGLTVGEDGATHQAIEDIALMRSIPNMRVVVPVDAVETKAAVRAAAEYRGPVYIRLGRAKVPTIYGDDYTFSWDKAHILTEGTDVAIFAAGYMVAPALDAARELKKQDLYATVVNIPVIKPIDEETITEVARKTGCVVTAEEHNIIGGLGSAVAEVLGEHYPVPIERVGVRDTFAESGKPGELLEKYGLTAAHIVEFAERAYNRKLEAK